MEGTAGASGGGAARVARRGAAVATRRLRKTFRSGRTSITATRDVDLDLEPGSMTALTGASGSGKSTLLHIIGAIETPDDGSVVVDDLVVTSLRRKHLADYRRGIGFVFQRFHLLPTLTALDNIVAPVLPYRTPFDRLGRARELLEAVGLGGRERALPAQLSGGEQQRIALARALLGHPRLLLADEPTGNLDSTTSMEIMELLETLRARYPMTVVIATHETTVRDRCDRVIRLRDGAIDDGTAGAGTAPRG